MTTSGVVPAPLLESVVAAPKSVVVEPNLRVEALRCTARAVAGRSLSKHKIIELAEMMYIWLIDEPDRTADGNADDDVRYAHFITGATSIAEANLILDRLRARTDHLQAENDDLRLALDNARAEQSRIRDAAPPQDIIGDSSPGTAAPGLEFPEARHR